MNLKFACYEPAGYSAEIDPLQHLLVIGSTGSGKSTLLTSATRQLLADESKPGLLILDAKVDGLVEQVQRDAREAGRESDVIVFGPAGDAVFDLLGGLRSADDVERVTRRLLLGMEPFNRDNAYWQQATSAMVSAALGLLVNSGGPITFQSAVTFMRQWFLSPTPPTALKELVAKLECMAGNCLSVAAALDQVQLWENLDSRTRTNIQSCLLQVLRPLLSPLAVRSFSRAGLATLSPAVAATQGKVCLVSVPALTEPDLAKFFFRLAKQEFFDAVQSRRQPPHRLCGLIADELPLLLTHEDVEQLGTVRSRHCFVIGATQGLDCLTQKLGGVAGRAVINHFNTVIYLRCREAETAVAAFVSLGMKKERARPARQPDWGNLVQATPPAPTTEVPVCPIGSLGRLAPHQAYLLFADGRRTLDPVWFVPWFEATHASPDPVVPANAESYSTAAHVQTLMQRAGFQTQCSTEVVVAAAKLLQRRNRKTLLKRARDFFLHKAAMVPAGLEQLPNPWLAALPGILWKLRKPHWNRLPYFIDRVGVDAGVLLLHFAQEQANPTGRLTTWDQLRITVNAAVYPSRWRALQPRHLIRLRQRHPGLNLRLDAASPPTIDG